MRVPYFGILYGGSFGRRQKMTCHSASRFTATLGLLREVDLLGNKHVHHLAFVPMMKDQHESDCYTAA
jgi:hypothetical protein